MEDETLKLAHERYPHPYDQVRQFWNPEETFSREQWNIPDAQDRIEQLLREYSAGVPLCKKNRIQTFNLQIQGKVLASTVGDTVPAGFYILHHTGGVPFFVKLPTVQYLDTQTELTFAL
jgi:hypothetical protein